MSLTFPDHAFVAYVNGVEVGRAHAGPPGYPMSSDQTAFWNRGITTTNIDVTAQLRVGSNVLAIQVNRWSTQTRLSVDASLTVGGSQVVAAGSSWKYQPGLFEPSGGLIDHSYFEYEIASVGTTKSTVSGGSSVPLDPTYYQEAKLEFMPWIELLNDGNETLFLGDYHLTNSPDRPVLYRLTFGLLAPGKHFSRSPQPQPT